MVFLTSCFWFLPHWSCQPESSSSGAWFEGPTPEILIIICCDFEKCDSSNHNLFVLPWQSQSRSTARWPPDDKWCKKVRPYFKIAFAFTQKCVFVWVQNILVTSSSSAATSEWAQSSVSSPLVQTNFIFDSFESNLMCFLWKLNKYLCLFGDYIHLKRAIAEDLGENGSGEHGEDGQDHRHAVCGDTEEYL